ncbi:hypothetical protein BC835DRAFT_1415700 [Cytidiella melzeri]|nr:hypothetical protein BC835DRAFT_1415700 [Cytidiella melzeri]
MPSASMADTLTEKMHLLDIEEDQLLQALEHVRSQRRELLNRATRIGYLPPEILLEIFKRVCVVGIGTLHDHSFRFAMTTPNVTLTHVCRAWRALAIESSVLWTTLDPARRGIAKATILRSREQQLDVIRPFSYSTALTTQVMKSYSRWQSLCWEFKSINEMKSLFSLMFSQDKPSSLRKITLRYPRLQYVASEPTQDVQDLAKLQTASLPVLEELSIENILLTEPFRCLFSPSLRCLSIASSSSKDYAANGFTISRLWLLLQPVKGLEQLSLSNCVPLWDTRLVLGNHALSLDASVANLARSIAPLAIDTLNLYSLHTLEWSNAPPKNIHKFFRLFDCNNLEHLRLGLDGRAKHLPSRRDESTWCSETPDGPFPLHRLRMLQVTTDDTYDLTLCLKKFDFPNVQTLIFICKDNGEIPHASDMERRRMGATGNPSCFPPSDSLFHDPRVTRNLTCLQILGGQMDAV